MKITIEVIEHHEQRYPTCGDWATDYNTKDIIVRVSDLGDWRYNFLMGLHEVIEAALCMDRGITADMVDKFDMDYEAKRDVGDTSEAGDDPRSPYFSEHFFATIVEKLMSRELELDWTAYEQTINELE